MLAFSAPQVKKLSMGCGSLADLPSSVLTWSG
jgi:hypothetical protein